MLAEYADSNDGEHSAESAEAHRSSGLTAKGTTGTRAREAGSFPWAHGGPVMRHVLRAFEDVSRRYYLRIFSKKVPKRTRNRLTL